MLERILWTVVVVFVGGLSSYAGAQDWPALRGADGNGAAKSDGVLSRSSDVGLRIRWKKTIGSGYSSVVVANDRVFVMFSGDTNDFLSCLNASDGETIWSVPIGPKFKGQNGSFDGPISTPLVHEEFVICLSADGKMFCFNWNDGSQVWTRDLVEKDGATKPMYGFATSPIVFEDSIILQTGVKEKSIAAFDIRSGVPRWAVGNGRVNSQSPTLTTLSGQLIVLAAVGGHLVGVDPVEGKELFNYRHEGANGSAMVPVVVAPGRVLMTLDDSFSTCVSMERSEDGVVVSQAWKQRSIKNTYNIPVVYEEQVYAYTTRILTSVNVESGRANWKNREPGDGFLIIVDGHLVINTKKGGLHIARASPDRYTEVAALKIFDQLVWSLPAYSNDSVFMRSLGEVARVDIIPNSNRTSDVAKADSARVSGPISRLQSQVLNAKSSEAKAQLVDQFLVRCDSFPLVENGLATFIYRGTGNDVAVASDIFGTRQERKMQQIEGTDLYYHSVNLVNDVRANYVFLVDYETKRDSRNVRSVTSTMYAGEMEFAERLRNEPLLEMSYFGMPDWKEPKFLEPNEKLSGQLIPKTIEYLRPPRRRRTGDENEDSESKLAEMEFDVYLPPGYDANGEARYPVVYVFDGKAAQVSGNMVNAIDNLFSTQVDRGGVDPAIVVFLNGQGPALAGVVATKIVPMIDREFLTVENRNGRSCIGNGAVAGMAVDFVSKNIDSFSGLATQSPMVFADGRKAVISSLKNVDQPIRIHIQWGMFDMHNPDENWDLRTMAEEIVSSISGNKNLNVMGGVVHDSADWASWRNRYDQVFRVLTENARRSD